MVQMSSGTGEVVPVTLLQLLQWSWGGPGHGSQDCRLIQGLQLFLASTKLDASCLTCTGSAYSQLLRVQILQLKPGQGNYTWATLERDSDTCLLQDAQENRFVNVTVKAKLSLLSCKLGFFSRKNLHHWKLPTWLGWEYTTGFLGMQVKSSCVAQSLVQSLTWRRAGTFL